MSVDFTNTSSIIILRKKRHLFKPMLTQLCFPPNIANLLISLIFYQHIFNANILQKKKISTNTGSKG